MLVGGQRNCCRFCPPNVVSICLYWAIRVHRAGDLHPAAVGPGLEAIQLTERVVAVLLQPDRPGLRVDRHPEAVAMTVREDLLHIGADLSADRRSGGEKRVVRGGAAVVLQPQHDAGEVGVVGLRAAKLVVGDGRTGARGCRPTRQVLQVATSADVTDEDVQLAVGAKGQDPTVVVAAFGLAGVLLDRPQPDQVVVEGEASTRSTRTDQRGCPATQSRSTRRYPRQWCSPSRTGRHQGRPGSRDATQSRAARAPSRSSPPDPARIPAPRRRRPAARGPSPSRGRACHRRR